MSEKSKILIVEARFYEDISDLLLKGAVEALEKAGALYQQIFVPGALEIPAAIKMASYKDFDAYVALGCVIRGETSHYDVVAGESARGLVDLGIRDNLAIGNGILTCDTHAQAIMRADPAQKDKGGLAARAALDLIKIKEKYGVSL